MNTLQGFRYYQPVRVKELAAPYQAQANPLWETIEGFGYKVHDYLFWNLSKEEEDAQKDGATTRMRVLRKRRRDDRLLQLGDAACSGEQVTERSPNVRDRIGSEKELKTSGKERGSGRKPIGAAPQRPLWQYARFPIFRWQVDELTTILGVHVEKLELDQWFQRLSDRATAEQLVLSDPWPWVKARTLDEAARLGSPMPAGDGADSQDAMWAAVAKRGAPK